MADSQREAEARARRQQSTPLEALAESPAGKASPGKLAILIDGECELCRNSADTIRRWDSSGAIEILDLQEPAHRARFPQFTLDRLLEELHAVDDRGRVYRGSDAINQILRRQPGLAGTLSYLWYIPGFAWLADRQYKRIAASRYTRSAPT
jgi:predicted DCC family thiol-disulfide oxidoreductase YuxK